MKQLYTFLLFFLLCIGLSGLDSIYAGNLDIGDITEQSQLSNVPKPSDLRVISTDTANPESVKVTLTWDSPEQAFRIYTRPQSGSKSTSIGYTQENPLELSFAPMSPYYYISISAVRKIGETIYESDKTQEVLVSWNRPTINAPSALRLDNVDTKNNTSTAYFSWQPVENAKQYKIYQSENGEMKSLGQVSGTTTSVTYPRFGDNIILTVSAVSPYGESAKSQPLGIPRVKQNTPTPTQSAIPETSPQAPKNLRVISDTIKNDKKEIEIQWDHTQYAQGYTVLIAVTGAYQPISSVNTNKAIVTAPASFEAFKIAVVAYNIHGTSDESNEITIKSSIDDVKILGSTKETSITSTPTPKPTNQEQDITQAFSVEEQPEEKEQITVGSAEEPTIQPSATPEAMSNDTSENETFVMRVIAFFQNIWVNIFG